MVAWPRWSAEMAGGGRGGGVVGSGKGLEVSEGGRGGREGSILALTLGGDISGRRLDEGGRRPALELGVVALRGLGEG